MKHKFNNIKISYGVDGWLLFFIYSLVLSAGYSLILGISEIKLLLDDNSGNLNDNIIAISIVSFFYLIIIGYLTYSAYLLKNMKPNAVSVARFALIVLLVSNFIGIAITKFTDELATNDDTTRAGQTFFYVIIWLSYLFGSKRIKNTFPVEKRKTYLIDKIIFTTIISLYILFFILVYIENSTQNDNNIVNDNLAPTSVNDNELSDGDLTDGQFVFKTPNLLLAQKEHNGIFPYYLISNDANLEIFLMSDNTSLDHQAYYDSFVDEAFENLSQGYEIDYELVDQSDGFTSQGFVYKKILVKIFGEITFIWSPLVVFDNKSDKVVMITYFDGFDHYNDVSHIDEVINSIVFK